MLRRACLRRSGFAQAGGTLRSIPHYARMSFVGYPPRIHPRSQRPWLSAQEGKIGLKSRIQTMIKRDFIILIFFLAAFIGLAGQGLCQESTNRERIISRFNGKVPRKWGERVRGVRTKLNTDQKLIALTFDACGGPRSNGYDAKLIEYLKSEKIPATLFISGKWIDANPEIFAELAKEPFFEIENHGLNHRPCSVNGRSAYGIAGTKGGEKH